MGFLKIGQAVKRFGDFFAVKNLSLEVLEGEIIVVLGPSGCGKTTLLRMISGLESIDSGEIKLCEKTINNIAPHLRNVAMVFQNYALYPHMTARKNMEFALKISGLEKASINERVNNAAGILGISKLLDKFPSQCSGGERQRIALGRAIVRRPSLFLFDEPLSNLDAGLREILRVELRAMLKELKATALYVTHDQAEAMTLGDRIAIMKNGELQQYSSPREVYDNPLNGFVASFLGMPRINIFGGKAKNGIFEANSGFKLPCPIADRENITLMVRPEHLSPSENGNLCAKLISSEYQGDRFVLHLSSNGQSMSSVVQSTQLDPAVKQGDTICFAVPQPRTLWFESPEGNRFYPE